ncbi:Dicer-like protein 1 [Gamsiella multidivaricata]|nr:Dicer-like protein 1 [Gamsiella multidivaricata]
MAKLESDLLVFLDDDVAPPASEAAPSSMSHGGLSGLTSRPAVIKPSPEPTAAKNVSLSNGSTHGGSNQAQANSRADVEVVVPKVEQDPLLVPRQYQIELFKKALGSNIIAVMDTGSGKTLVAVMLIKEMIQREQEAWRNLAERKICFFIVHNVPLVFQQAAVIRSNCAGEVIEMCGPNQKNKFQKDWDVVFETADVIVLTAQILSDLLRHGYIKMNRIHLLVFDECHHARKDHPFCKIMKEFYHNTPERDRPKVFGMTASPSMDTGSKLYHSAKELESLMDARIFTVDQEMVQSYVQRPSEFVVHYHSPPLYNPTKLTHQLREQCFTLPRLESPFSSVTHNLKHLGPWCVDRLWKLYLHRLAEASNFKQLDHDARAAVNISKSLSLRKPVCDESYLSPKVLKLVQLLRVAVEGLGDDFCGIIFVERRDTAMALCLLLEELEEFQDIFRVQILAGHGEGGEQVLRMTFQEQTAIISYFRHRVYNLLVATSVGEEGLDIQPCNVVIRFDPASTPISYIQSRGRARKANSRFIIMQELDNRAEEATFEKIKYSEKNMKEWCHSLDDERLMRSPIDMDDDDVLDKLAPAQIYRVPSTGAILTLDSAVALVHYYCSTLAGDEFCSLRPNFNIMSNGASGFICDLILPPNAPIRIVQSDRTSTKSMAKKSAAFKACEKLHSLHALNDNLLPIMVDLAKDEKPGEEKAVDNKDKNKSYPMASPTFWKRSPSLTETIPLFGCVMELTKEDLDQLGGKSRFRTMCLLTYQPLPCDISPFNLYVEGAPRLVTLKSSPVPMQVDEGRRKLLKQFTLNLFQRMCRKTFECALEGLPYFVAPLTKTYVAGSPLQTGIAWDNVKLGQSLEPLPITEEDKVEAFIMDSVVTLRTDYGRDFFIKKILRIYRVKDVMPPEDFKQELAAWDVAIAKGKATALELSNGSDARAEGRTFAAYFKWKYSTDCTNDDLILSVDRVRKMRNHLQPAVRDEERRDDASANIVPLSACMRCSVSADVLRMSQLVPSILFSLDSTLLVQEVRMKFGFMRTRLDLLQVAFTTSSANRDYQYERLEFLGDSFLKFASTIRLYIINPSKDEGQLHASRIRIISNRALLGHATKLELYRYVTSIPFHRKSWRPTQFVVDGKPCKEVQYQNLSNKTLADIVEASLGAAYLSGGVTNGFHVAKTLGIPFDEFAEWSDFHRVFSRMKMATLDNSEDRTSKSMLTRGQLLNIQDVQKLLDYEFKDPFLFVEAMTHASHIRNDSVCYQRLEFLGDAVLDFQVVRYCYEKYPSAPPGAVTLIKDASVNNAILGAISINWGLHHYLNHYSSTLVGAIARAIVSLEFKTEQSPTKTLEGEYWSDITMPKVLGDLVESTLGAVFVDSGFDFDVISGLFARLIQPFLDKHVNFENIVIHPSKALLESLQAKGCNNFAFENEDGAQENSRSRTLRRLGLGAHNQQTAEGARSMKCHFKIHDKIVATATGDQVEDLRKEVAIATMALLKGDTELLGTLCTCPKRSGARHKSVLDRYRE